MIEESKIKDFVTQWNLTSGITILRADQMAKKPAYPYATYKEIISNEENVRSNIKERSYDAGDQEVTLTTNELSETTVSVNCFSNTHQEAKTKVEILRFALKTQAVNKKAKDLNMTLLLGLTPVQDRTILFEGVSYEYCFGFDFIIRANTPHTEIFESIESVAGTITTVGVDETTENEIIYEVTS